MGTFFSSPRAYSLIAVGITFCGCEIPVEEFDSASSLANLVSGQNAYAHVEALVGFGPRPAGSDALEESRSYLIEQLSSLGWETKRETFKDQIPQGEVEFINLRARFGNDRWREKVSGLLGSHYDTKSFTGFAFVGANDGGSSSGLLVELARVLASRPEIAKEIELVFFDGGEAFGPNLTAGDGLYGSKHYAKELLLTPKQIPDWALILDRVGDKDLNIRAGVQIPTSSLEGLDETRGKDYRVDVSTLQDRIGELSRDLLYAAQDLDARKEVGVSPDYLIGDHIPLNIVVGIPTIVLVDSDYAFTHTPGDTLEKVSAESLEITGKATLQMVEKYLMP